MQSAPTGSFAVAAPADLVSTAGPTATATVWLWKAAVLLALLLQG